MSNEKVIVKENKNKVVVSTPGPQGPRGRTILNGTGVPANNLGLSGDFYYDTDTSRFYGPKLSDLTWAGAQNYPLNNAPSDFAKSMSWEMAEIQYDNNENYYYVNLTHNLIFYPNITVKDSTKDVVETGIEYIDLNTIKLTMAQPFSGTAYLS